MTGFGKAEAEIGNKKIAVQIKSLNSKQADISTKLPNLFKDKELTYRKIISKSLIRGKIELSISYETLEGSSGYELDESLFKTYYEQVTKISKELGEKNSNLIETISRFPEILKSKSEDYTEEGWQEIEKLVYTACENAMRFRRDEGKSLEEDLRLRVKNIENKLEEALLFEGDRIETVKERLENKLKEFEANGSLNQDRFEQELIYYLEKYDISEEKVRLKTHCNYFLQVLDEETSQGKKLGFIGQEMGREINTLGSKANHAQMQQKVVEMKDELEKIKEQILNVL